MSLGVIITSILVPIILIIIWLVISYNGFQLSRAKVENSWGQVNVQLKMRADLVPNLVNTVSGYAKHESETLNNVMHARNECLQAQSQAETIRANNELNGVLGRLFAVSESYPDLKANQNFMDLQNQLKEIEQKIAMYRQFYNDTVLMYNRKIIIFPSNIMAALFGFIELPYFNITEQESAAPKVLF